YSPAVALNRIFALYKARGRETAMQEAAQLPSTDNHFYHLLMGELYSQTDNAKALSHFQKAYAQARTQTEKQGIRKKISDLGISRF
ncbi:MAG TPA: RNA polymerase subunit sigma, partial [Niastella sp.]